MSTRARVILKDTDETLHFYRHSDGYPSGTMPTLKKFIGWIVTGKIRGNVGQCSGWLVLVGAEEYRRYGHMDDNYKTHPKKTVLEPDPTEGNLGWKAGAYEPAGVEVNDFAWSYEIDLDKKELTISHGYPAKSKTITFASVLRRKWKTDKI
jgi:hypothetical protein